MQKAILMLIIISLLQGIGYAETQSKDGTARALDYMGFVSSEPLSKTFDNKVFILVKSPIFGWRIGKKADANCYSIGSTDLISLKAPIEFWGINIYIRNKSDEVKVIRWSESTFVVGDFSGLPFLDGMKYVNANNPSALPDTVLPPGQDVDKAVYLSRVTFSGIDWYIDGEYIPKNNKLKASLYLKILDAKGNSNYYSISTPTIGMREQ